MTIAERIMLIIEDKNINMSQFAELLNVTPAYISKIKKYPETVPSDRILADICRLFHVNDVWLKTGEGKMYSPQTRSVEIAEMTAQLFNADGNDIRYQLMRRISQMSPEQVKIVKDLVLELADAVKDSDKENGE